jgi:hypothetical protein
MKRIYVLIFSLLGVLLMAYPAGAIIGGTPDGGGHPNTASILLNGRRLCTGVLISPTALATAGHCTEIALSNGGIVQVTFDPTPTASSTFYLAEELITAPEFTFDNPNQGTPHAPPDLGVIILSTAVTGITPAPLPGIGTLNTVNRKTTVFQAVGYGTYAFEGNTPQSPPARNVANVKLATGEGGVGPSPLASAVTAPQHASATVVVRSSLETQWSPLCRSRRAAAVSHGATRRASTRSTPTTSTRRTYGHQLDISSP